MTKKTINWYELDKSIESLATDEKHEISVQREAIPIIFVPGIMGSRLRRTGTDGSKDNKSKENLPNLRWDATSSYALGNYLGSGPAYRKAMLIGKSFDPDYLEVNNTTPVGDGWAGIIENYHPFLHTLKTHEWGALDKLFVFPVFAFGYNWTDDNTRSGEKLAIRIKEIIKEAESTIGLCKQVILITHSMGGLVARAASKLAGAEVDILGIIHGVQPALGAPGAYWRIKAGFESSFFSPKGRISSSVLGSTGKDTTPILGNSIGGLQLLPNKDYHPSKSRTWLWIRDANGIKNATSIKSLPEGSPYDSIYRVKAIVKPNAGKGASNNAYWGLIDPDLLTPEISPPLIEVGVGLHGEPHYELDYNDLEYRMRKMKSSDSAWNMYKINLALAEKFHNDLGKYAHPKTWCFHGYGLDTAEFVEFHIESNWIQTESYPTRGFRGFFRDASDKSMQAVLQTPAGDGDGTVPVSSATTITPKSPDNPQNQGFENLEHQPAYENPEVQRWVICAITALCKLRFKKKHG